MKHFLRKETKEELNLANTEGELSLNDEEREMIHGVISLDDTTVKESMVPRIDGKFLDCDLGYDEVMKIIVESNFSRYPVYKNNIDNVIGVLYAKDLLKSLYQADYFRREDDDAASSIKEFKIEALLRPAFFVPESKKLDSLLREFKKKHVHIAVAIDEYGGVSGILCLEDIIEHIVGNIQDEFDDENEQLVALNNSQYLCDARMNIEDINSQLNIKLPNEDFDTIGGFVFDLFGTIPSTGEQVTYDGLDFVVQELEGHKIKKIKIIVRAKQEENDDKRDI